ncbi:MAG: TIGR00180 family glycosyltransferase [Candidatus Omnitrophica bacterium]|nr:TIGR00180 family glycosyltransferase [Candidatus Omnitrophota bacterium]MDD5429912.1 TIGR00180 family glycosyltransferase [Candidatus Omnitrophota bacterium]
MLTIMISTKNRSDFLIRLLNYYAEVDYKHLIVIGDSSDSYHFAKTERVVKNLEGRLKIRHYKHLGLNLPTSIRELIRVVSTPYAGFIADDDFLIPSRFEEAIKFLENNPGYSAVQGVGILFSLKSSGPYGEFSSISPYVLRSIESDTASKRFIDHLNSYSVTLFSIYKTQTWKKMYKNITKIEDRAFADELLPCFLSVIYGKVKKLPGLYLVRQVHDRRYHLPDIYDWFTKLDWFPSYRVFHDSLIEGLLQQENIPQEKAQAIFKKAFWGYLNDRLSDKFKQRYGILSPKDRAKKISKCIPGAYKIVKRIKQLFSSKELTLNSLLNKKSTYYTDFLPVYNAVINIPKDYQEEGHGGADTSGIIV